MQISLDYRKTYLKKKQIFLTAKATKIRTDILVKKMDKIKTSWRYQQSIR